MTLLSKGLNYVPHTNSINNTQINKNITRFERTLQIHHFFTNKNTGKNLIPNKYQAFSKNSSWWPYSVNAEITQFCKYLKENILDILHKPSKYNNISKKSIKHL